MLIMYHHTHHSSKFGLNEGLAA